MPMFPPTFLDAEPIAVTDRSQTHWLDQGWSLLLSAARPLRLADAARERRLTAEQGRRLLHRIVGGVTPIVASITDALIAGSLKLSGWFRSFRDAIIPGHFAGALAVLNDPEPPPADMAAIADAANRQVGFLARFRDQIKVAAVLLGDGVRARAELYGHAAWGLAQSVWIAKKLRDGHTIGRSVLGLSDHCGMCLDEARKGWQELADIVPPGDRTCQSRCKCWVELR